MSYVMVHFFVFSELRLELIVCFVDIGGIVDHHCLHFLIIKFEKCCSYRLHNLCPLKEFQTDEWSQVVHSPMFTPRKLHHTDQICPASYASKQLIRVLGSK